MARQIEQKIDWYDNTYRVTFKLEDVPDPEARCDSCRQPIADRTKQAHTTLAVVRDEDGVEMPSHDRLFSSIADKAWRYYAVSGGGLSAPPFLCDACAGTP